MRSLYRVGGTARAAKPLARRGRLGRMVVVRLLAVGAPPVMAGAARAGDTVVSLTFNDGLLTQYTNARPVLQAYNMNATFLNALRDRLRGDAPSGTAAKTVRQVMSGG
jgi:peptidoglycan/xylan/chitin deacetylase (PgdA/CDA1 family)